MACDCTPTPLPPPPQATSLALRAYPQLNAHVNSGCTALTVCAAHNIALAMDTPRGLLVPNIKNVQNLSVWQIHTELQRLQALGKAGMIGRQDLAGGTFTLSNIGRCSTLLGSALLRCAVLHVAGVTLSHPLMCMRGGGVQARSVERMPNRWWLCRKL